MPYSSLHLRAAVIYVFVGMLIGMGMAMTNNFTIAPAHAHLNLVGFVAMSIYGLVLKSFPEAETWRTTKIQFWAAQAGVLVMIVGLIALLGLGNSALGEPLSALGGAITLVAMGLFATIVYRVTAIR